MTPPIAKFYCFAALTALLSAAVLEIGCGGGAASSAVTSVTQTTTLHASATLSIQGVANVRVGSSAQFAPVMSDGGILPVVWSVNGENGGDTSIGTINSAGQFFAPRVLPAITTVTLKATQTVSPFLSASMQVQLLNPTPSVQAVATVVQPGSVTFTIAGSNFVPGSLGVIRELGLSGGTLTTPGAITFTVPAGSAVAVGSVVHVAVRNPDPGTSDSPDFPFRVPTTPVPTAVPHLPATPFDYVAYAVTNLPAHYRDPGSPAGDLADADNTPAANPITNAGATLGRVLFYDKFLSANNTVACGSCHLQAFGFGDPNQFSGGFLGQFTSRRSMGLSNAKFYQRGHFFSDEHAVTLEDQTLQPIQNSIEMGNTLSALIPNMQATSYYPPLFQAAFGTPEVTSDRIASAISQFIRSMVSYQSKYDQAFAAGTNGNPNFAAVFTPSELHGQQLFTSLGCTGCHGTGGHISFTVQNVGLDRDSTADPGAGLGAFKAPSLRNVGARIWFMHDGRFLGLGSVIEFYNSGVQDNPNLSPLMRNADGTVKRLNLSAQDKQDLSNFLLTLTDNAFLTDPKFASPF